MFWSEADKAGQPVCTQNDLDTFTHILFLDISAEIIAKRRVDDKERRRPSTSASHLHRWQETEKTQLRRLCRNHGILFSTRVPGFDIAEQSLNAASRFPSTYGETKRVFGRKKLDEALIANQNQLETVMVIDADRTFSALGYSYTAFRQAALWYEEIVGDQEFDDLCEVVASVVAMYPEFVSLLRMVAGKEHVRAVVVTCGLRRVWEKVLEREGLSKMVEVIGGGRISDGFVITGAVKGALVTRLQRVHRKYVWAFGDSPLDLDMLIKADRAIIVVGKENPRSKSMDAALMAAIDKDSLRGCQVVLSCNAPPRLNTNKLPLIQLTEQGFIDSVLCRRSPHAIPQFIHATDRGAAKLLMTPMRDATNFGPVLREAHRGVGRYLGTEFLTDLIGVEEYPIPHVQGNNTSGYRLVGEQQTLIVALMRGGEPMAVGVNEVFPLAMFLHANCADDITINHLRGRCTVVLVDSVVNSGGTVMQFVEHIRKLHATIRIVVVAGVVQAEFISRGSPATALACYPNLNIVALRLSNNKFTGRGSTDTGNRLFNTIHIP
ncbi:hypothetical protein ACJ73_02423 [Blastomyces percursus]|uniref:Phosphoribosyltransferase domain-containing protein n=1 Tax=Blastomyces percursus TaxID=1658174 RepID=A0A1J9REX8_9EURO|nr:hypothetical protein ACJ73_02423 [Blastomyces percursus]